MSFGAIWSHFLGNLWFIQVLYISCISKSSPATNFLRLNSQAINFSSPYAHILLPLYQGTCPFDCQVLMIHQLPNIVSPGCFTQCAFWFINLSEVHNKTQKCLLGPFGHIFWVICGLYRCCIYHAFPKVLMLPISCVLTTRQSILTVHMLTFYYLYTKEHAHLIARS